MSQYSNDPETTFSTSEGGTAYDAGSSAPATSGTASAAWTDSDSLTESSSGDTGSSEGGSSAKETAAAAAGAAKQQASEVKDAAAQAGQHVTAVAKEQAGSVASEAGQHAKNLLSQSRSELKSQASSQQQRVAGGVRSLAEQLTSMSSNVEQPGVASDFAGQAAERVHSVAGWIEDREPAELLDELTTYARRRPMVFLGLAAGAGVLFGRLARGLRDDASDSGSTGTQADFASYDAARVQVSEPAYDSGTSYGGTGYDSGSTGTTYGSATTGTGYGSQSTDGGDVPVDIYGERTPPTGGTL